jgi:hypothetical protein
MFMFFIFCAHDKQLADELTALNACFDLVELVRDKSTGLSKGFAFITFVSIEHAMRFVEPLFPRVMIASTWCGVNYKKLDEHSEWTCPNV